MKSTKRRRIVLKRTLLGLLITVLALEGTARFMLFARNGRGLFTRDRFLNYRLRPNNLYRNETYGTVRTDSWGCRIAAQAKGLPPQSNSRRILLLGDSVVFGSYVDYEESFAHRLQLQLDQAAPEQFQVINGGVHGYTLEQVMGWYEAYGYSFAPETVIYFFNPNDLLPPFVLSAAGELVLPNESNALMENSAAYCLLHKRFKAPSNTADRLLDTIYFKEPSKDLWLSQRLQEMKTVLAHFSRRLRAENRDFKVIIVPRAFEALGDIRFRNLDAIQSILKDLQIEFSYPLPYFSGEKARSFYHDAGHFSPEGHTQMSGVLYSLLKKDPNFLTPAQPKK